MWTQNETPSLKHTMLQCMMGHVSKKDTIKSSVASCSQVVAKN